MSLCIKCKCFLPPGFTEETSDKKGYICIFCKRERDVLDYVYEGKQKQATKQEIVSEYRKFLKDLKDKPNIKKLIVQDAIKGEIIK